MKNRAKTDCEDFALFELIFLGTSASAPSIQRGLSSAVVIAGEYRFMIDCGEGTQRQLLRSGLGFRRLDKILLTHGHLDHILGLGGLASTLGRWEALDELNIYGGEPTLQRVHGLMDVVFGQNQMPSMGISLNRLHEGLIFEAKKFTLSAFPVQHRGAGCFGFTFEERTRRPFLADKAAALNIPQGPVRRDLSLGQTVTLEDGRVIEPDQILGPARRGAKLCFVGDVGRTGPLHKIVHGADLLAIESTYIDEDREIAKAHGHLTAKTAARLALKAEVGHLVLHHISRRYNARQLLAEAREVFPNTHVASDLDALTIRRGEPVHVTTCRERNQPAN